MKPHVLLRISAALNSVFVAGHTLGLLNQRASSPEEQAVISAMQADRFDMLGTPRTLWDLFVGAQWFMSVGGLVLMVALWQVGGLARRHGAAARPLVLTLALGAAGYAFLSWRYFFVAPLATFILSALFAGAAWVQLGRAQQAPAAALQP